MRDLCTILMLIFLVQSSYGQSGIGIGGGGAVSTFDYGGQVSNVDNFDSENAAGYTGGIRMDFALDDNEFSAFSPEFFIIQNGSKEYYNNFQVLQNDLINRAVSLDYVGIYLPLTLYIPMGVSGDDDVYNGILLQGRLFADYAFSATVEDDYLGVNEVKFNKEMDRIDFGYSAEFGFVMNGMKLSFGYNWDIKNIEFTNALGNFNDEDYLINNKGFTVQIGYLFKN